MNGINLRFRTFRTNIYLCGMVRYFWKFEIYLRFFIIFDIIRKAIQNPNPEPIVQSHWDKETSANPNFRNNSFIFGQI